MSKYIFKTVDKDVLDYHELADTSKLHYVSAYGSLLPVYLAQDPSKREAIHYLLTKPTQDTVVGKGYKKAFVLPNFGIKQDRIKECLKEHGMRITTDTDEADVVISHLDIDNHFESGANINTKLLLADLWNYNAYHISGTSMSLIYQRDKDEHKYNNTWDWDEDEYTNIYEMDYFTGCALELAYKISAESLPVVSLDTVMNESATRQVMTYELWKMLDAQISAGNDDRALAFKMVPTIDPDSNHHLLWSLAQKYNSELYYNRRDKDMKYWYEKARIEDFYDMGAEQMIIWLKENNLLTSKAFRFLEPIVRKEIRISNRDLYVFKVAVKPEYREYLKINNNE